MLEQLRERIDRLASSSGARRIGVALRCLDDGAELRIGDDLRFHAASTIKLLVMIEAMRLVDRGEIGLADEIPVVNEFSSAAGDAPFSLDVNDDSEKTLYDAIGGAVPVRRLLHLMITESSNLATNVLLDRVGAEAATDGARRLGARDTALVRGMQDLRAFDAGINNVTSAGDLLEILTAIARGSAIGPAASAAMLDILLAQRINDGIPAGLPEDHRVAHKTGTITGIAHDAAIVFPPKPHAPWVLVVLTEGIADRSAGRRLIAGIAREVHSALALRQVGIVSPSR